MMDITTNIKLAQKLGEQLVAKQLKLVTAESCTGGEIASVLTSVPGSSKWFERGFVTYSNAAKIELLSVSPDIIEQEGAVSKATAIAMAEGAIANSQGDIAIAVTGIAGPEGGSKEKPVGTVWISWSVCGKVEARLFQFQGDRLAIRHQAVQEALRYFIV